MMERGGHIILTKELYKSRKTHEGRIFRMMWTTAVFDIEDWTKFWKTNENCNITRRTHGFRASIELFAICDWGESSVLDWRSTIIKLEKFEQETAK